MKSQIQFWNSVRVFSFLLFCVVGLSVVLPAFAGDCPADPAAMQNFSDCTNCKTDLNDDSAVGTADLLTVNKCIHSGCADLRYDVDGDGKVTENDSAVLLKCIKLSILNKG